MPREPVVSSATTSLSTSSVVTMGALVCLELLCKTYHRRLVSSGTQDRSYPTRGIHENGITTEHPSYPW